MKCCRMLKLKKLDPGHVMFTKGDRGDEFFLIVEGSVTGEFPTGSAPRDQKAVVGPQSSLAGGKKVFRLGAGSSFGELSILGRTDSERTRTATVTCGSKGCVLATLTREDYLHVTGKLEAVALAALRKNVPDRPDKPGVGERTLSETQLVWSYLKVDKF